MIKTKERPHKVLPNTFNSTGLDGSGKSTQTMMLEKVLQDIGYDVVTTKAYHDEHKARYGSLITKLAQNGELGNLALTAVFKLFERQQLIKTLISVKEGKIVLIDRWDESFEAYHRQTGILSKLPRIRQALSGLAFGNYIPRQTYFHDISYESAQSRMRNRGKLDVFDSKGKTYHDMMRNGMLQLSQERGWYIVDAEQTIQEIHAIVAQATLSMIDTNLLVKKQNSIK